jgi:hypothetical protein
MDHSLIAFVPRALAAEFLVLGTLFLSYSIARRILPRASAPLRWSATAIVGMWLASAAFHVLLALRAFRLPVAVAGLAGALLLWHGVARPSNPWLECLAGLRRDVAWPLRLARACLGASVPRRLATCGFAALLGLAVLVTCVRASILPPLGWDSVTTYAVKVGMWVQSGGPATFDAPGGWRVSATNFGGAQLLGAWAMLPFHGDLVFGLVDAVEWVLLGVACHALGRELGLRVRHAALATSFILFVPALWFSVGSGYSEPALNLALAVAIAFAVVFLRPSTPPRDKVGALILSLVALGVVSGIKVTALPAAAVIYVTLAAGALLARPRAGHRRPIAAFLAGSLAAAAIVTPWLWHNVRASGFPLGAVPITIAGLHLGQATPGLAWFNHHPELRPFEVGPEIKALAQVFAMPAVRGPHLGRLALLPFLIAPFALRSRLARGRWPVATGLMLTGALGAVALAYFQPGFSVVRLLWAVVNGRFLLPAVILAVIVSFGGCRRGGALAGIYMAVIAGGILLDFWTGAGYGRAPFERVALPSGALLAVIVAVAGLLALRSPARRPATRGIALAGALLAPLLALTILDAYRERHREELVEQGMVLDPIPKYWPRAAALLDAPGPPRRVAVTSGPNQHMDAWFLYYFMGRSLQNRFAYVPISRDGSFVDFDIRMTLQWCGDAEAWIERLGRAGVTEVLSFPPHSAELRWMEERPARFRRLAGDGKTWGLYSVIPAA